MRRKHSIITAAALVLATGGIGCNAILGIHPPSDEDWDGSLKSSLSTDPGSDAESDADENDASDGGTLGPDADAMAASFDVAVNPHAWADWPMPNAPMAALPNPQSYDTSMPGVVVDRVTGLHWQQTIPDASATWSDALAQCAALTMAGGGWRLPSRIELVSILNVFSAAPAAAIDPTAFPSAPADSYWTSSSLAGDPKNAWLVDFGSGTTLTHSAPVDGTHRVRCVR
jgi:hypothetical protein